MALIAAVYIQAVRLGRIDNATFTARMTGLSIGLIFGTLALFYGIRRKRQPLDDAWGPSYRKLEICFYVFVLYLLALVGVNCVLEDIFAISFFSDITFVIAVSLIIQAFSLWFSKHHSTKELLVDALH
jgi:uncharacterized Tic20 family protein